MSKETHRWIVRDSVNGWCVEHSGPSRMTLQPNQYGAVHHTKWVGEPPMSEEKVLSAVKTAHVRLLGKRFGTRFSNERRNVCCEYAAALNEQTEARV